MANLIRARQRVLTGVHPHNANKKFIVPKRLKPAVPGPASQAKK